MGGVLITTLYLVLESVPLPWGITTYVAYVFLGEEITPDANTVSMLPAKTLFTL